MTKLIRVADMLGADWMLIGAAAVSKWGFPRATQDVDFTIAVGEGMAPEVDFLAGIVEDRIVEGFKPPRRHRFPLDFFHDSTRAASRGHQASSRALPGFRRVEETRPPRER